MRSPLRIMCTPQSLRRTIVAVTVALAVLGLPWEPWAASVTAAESTDTQDQFVLGLVDQGRQDLESNRLAAAVRNFTAAIMKDAQVAQAYLLRGRAHDLMGEQSRAVQDFDRYIELKPSDPTGYIMRGDARTFNMEHETALEDYTKAIALAPKSIPAHLGRGLTYTGLERYGDAIKDYQWVLAMAPQSSEALVNMGIACMLGRRVPEALHYFERALKVETDSKWRGRITELIEKLLQNPKAEPGARHGSSRGPMW